MPVASRTADSTRAKSDAREPRGFWLQTAGQRHLDSGAYQSPQRLSPSDLESGDSDRRTRLARELVALTELQEDWDTYGAQPPSRSALRKAFRHLLHTWEVLLPEKVLPSVEGGVTLVYSSNRRRYAEIEFDNEGDVIAAFRRRDERPEIWSVRQGQAAVTRLRRLLGLRV